jgi:hypothetical protein
MYKPDRNGKIKSDKEIIAALNPSAKKENKVASSDIPSNIQNRFKNKYGKDKDVVKYVNDALAQGYTIEEAYEEINK